MNCVGESITLYERLLFLKGRLGKHPQEGPISKIPTQSASWHLRLRGVDKGGFTARSMLLTPRGVPDFWNPEKVGHFGRLHRISANWRIELPLLAKGAICVPGRSGTSGSRARASFKAGRIAARFRGPLIAPIFEIGAALSGDW